MKQQEKIDSGKGLLQLEIEQSQDSRCNQDKDQYSNQWEFIFSIIGVTVGFGSFWRFPYLIFRNGGGVFLIPYLVAMVFIGIPLLYLQTAVGQMHRISLPFILNKIHPALKMLGIGIMLSTLHFSSVYNILLTYSYRFLFTAFNPNIPFANQKITQNTYFSQQILRQSDSIQSFQAINPDLFVLYIVSLLICHYIIKNGAKATGKVVIYTASLPFIIIFLLMLRGMFLDKAFDGLAYLFKPQWSKLWTTQIWIDATVQVFYQLSLGIGTIINLASNKKKKQKFMNGILIVPLSIILCGLLSAATIFMYLAQFCHDAGISINDSNLQLSGPELTFNVFPKALALLPFSNLLLLLFFIAMIMLGIDSEFGMLQALYCYLKDQQKIQYFQVFGIKINGEWSRYILLGLICVGCPTLTSHAGIYYLQFYDYFMSNIPFTLGACTQLYIFVYLFPFKQLQAQIKRYTGQQTPYLIRYCLQSKWLIGLLGCNLLFAVFNQITLIPHYSLYFNLIGWTITLYPIILAYIHFKKHWTNRKDLCLNFYELQHRPSYF